MARATERSSARTRAPSLALLLLLAGVGCSSTDEAISDQIDPRECMKQSGAVVANTSTDTYGQTIEFRLPHGGIVDVSFPEQANMVQAAAWQTSKQNINPADRAIVDECFPLD
jgi:hypothetical protein